MGEEQIASRQKAEDSSGSAHAEIETESTAKQSLTVPPESPQVPSHVPQVSQKTQVVRPGRDNGVGILKSAAKKAARSNSRSDVHEYMRLRRGYV